MSYSTDSQREFGACGVGLVASRTGTASHQILTDALKALMAMEHRGGCAADQITGDGAGILTDIPFDLFGYEPGTVAVGTLFLSQSGDTQRAALKLFERCMAFSDLKVLDYRQVPVDVGVLGSAARGSVPQIVQVFIERPASQRVDESFNRLLYLAQQKVRRKLSQAGLEKALFFVSLSTTTIVYKGLTQADALPEFYLDLKNPAYRSRFALIHRRFSTNTRTTWDKAQPFRMIAHNGEINTISGNLGWSQARQNALGLEPGELLTHHGSSDSGNLNEQIEALRYRSGISGLRDVLAITVPPARTEDDYYAFWGRAMEPWDGPAFIAYADGVTAGARLDRSGFRPARWALTDDTFYLASEAGIFGVKEEKITRKGALQAGSGVHISLINGDLVLTDPATSGANQNAEFDPRLVHLAERHHSDTSTPSQPYFFNLSDDEYKRCLLPMISTGKEAIGSMGDTAQLALLSTQDRSLFDFMYQNFAQVTNPPLDYLREAVVTDLKTVIGSSPNIYSPKELLPLQTAYTVNSPLLSEGQLNTLYENAASDSPEWGIKVAVVDICYRVDGTVHGFRNALKRVGTEVVEQSKNGAAVIILTDRDASSQYAPLPVLLVLAHATNLLNEWGQRLATSVVVDTGQVRTTHHFACLIGFGATAVCPSLAWGLARTSSERSISELSIETRQENLRHAFEHGLLRIMSKSGISSVSSYRGAKLFTPIGLSQSLLDDFFCGLSSPVGGLELSDLAQRAIDEQRTDMDQAVLPKTFRFKESRHDGEGEQHAMTALRARRVHELVDIEDPDAKREQFFADTALGAHPIRLTDLLDLRQYEQDDALMNVESKRAITARFGSGAMSFGALSAEAQRDIFTAMRLVGGRSNSGEGGENPFYYVDGHCADTKQIASGRFGVTAEYLVSGKEIEIKMAQGAKPGEGGQLMGIKVDEHIAFARRASPGIDLISPPPLHDIYSIEDLKELIETLRELSPSVRIVVKLVSGAHIGAIAAGVVKAGADIIQISGGSGGTGAAPLSSMMHAGLPWELGLVDVHKTLLAYGLRSRVLLRVDGGLHSGRDVVIAALLGAQEFAFGKSLLIAQGCIMARVCQTNKCPRGIATQDPKFKEKYRGSAEQIVSFLDLLAEDVRQTLAHMGVQSIEEIVGLGSHYLKGSERFDKVIEDLGIDLSLFLHGLTQPVALTQGRQPHMLSGLNQLVLDSVNALASQGRRDIARFDIKSVDRAIPVSLFGQLAAKAVTTRRASVNGQTPVLDSFLPDAGTYQLSFTGSAGQGFGAFLVDGVDLTLLGEANDSVGKSMSGGRLLITPHPEWSGVAEENVIIGNSAFYGATGGRAFIHGLAGDRFCVRNSGASAVVEGAGFHACEYMTGGDVVILGSTHGNIGAGMTGGRVFVRKENFDQLNRQSVFGAGLDEDDLNTLQELLKAYLSYTNSRTAKQLLASPESLKTIFGVCKPLPSQVKRLAKVA